MQRSETIGDLITALSKAQSDFGPALKQTTNSAFGSKYADLAANIDAVRPALNKHGIALLQFPEVDLETQTVSVTTSLHHGEQHISQTFVAPAVGRQGFNVQSIGAATTYLRRYGLQALCGLASEDDDGNSVATENAPIPKKEKEPKVTEAELDQWREAFMEAQTIDEWNQQIVPLMKERSREFIVAAAEQAKLRGYKVDRSSGLYTEVKK
jgi:hypothetical protein